MSASLTRVLGMIATAAYAAFIISLYMTQPRTFAQVKGGVVASVGVYAVVQAHFQEGLRYFRNDQFPEARAAFARADPAERDPVTQFYVAYSLYRQGWGRLYSDDELYRRALEALDRAVAAAPDGRIAVADPDLGIQTADELRAELERGLRRDLSDFNPLRVLRERQ